MSFVEQSKPAGEKRAPGDSSAVIKAARASRWRTAALDLIPPAAIRFTAAFLGRHVRFAGSFGTWDEACNGIVGYEDASILERVRHATREVVKGTAVAERDGQILSRLEPPLPLIVAILRAARRDATTTVLDFGGALGGTYHQCRPFLGDSVPLRWVIVEQEAFAKCGRREFETDVVRFYGTLDDALAEAAPSVVLFSSVLQYLEDPWTVLRRAAGARPHFIVIDRTPFLQAASSVIALQLVPSRFGRVRYPAWLFNMEELLRPLQEKYRLLYAFDTVDGCMTYGIRRVDFNGFLFERKE